MVRALRLAGLPHLESGPDTERSTPQEPIGAAGGAAGATAGRNTDWYGYCLDDPVHGRDPEGLFRFGVRDLDNPLGGAIREEGLYATAGRVLLPFGMGNRLHEELKAIEDAHNTHAVHEHGFYEDGSEKNIGFGDKGIMDSENINSYRLEQYSYGDNRMHRAEKSVGAPGDYSIITNNCQDYADKLRSRYRQLERGDKQR